jgi:hypothetical protein
MNSITSFVERALRGRCIICNRRLPKAKIALYHAYATYWEIGMKESEGGTVEVCVCGEKCHKAYADGKDAQKGE